MQGRNPIIVARNALVITILSVALNGCLSQEESAQEETLVGETLSDHVLTGSVGDGPIVGAKVRVLAKDGTKLAELESDGSAGYTVTVRTKGKYYPLTLDARNGVDIVTNLTPDFDLFGAALEPSKKSVANINPFSTITYELARDMVGGISKSNLDNAQAVVSEALNSGLSTLVETGPMSTPIDTTNIAEIIKASETLGELVRRIRDLQQMHNRAASGNSVIRAVASDLTDGVIDGRGGPRVEARVAALAVVTAVPVLLESMQNELHVNGQDATSALSEAMNQVSKGNVTMTIGDLTVTAQMLDAVRVGLDALLAAAPDAKLQELHDAVESLQVGMDFASIRALIPRDYRTTLEQSLMTVAGGDESSIATINTVSRDGGADPVPANNPPTISGTPPTSVEQGTTYSFTPTASDAEGNTLSFTVVNQPPWTSFDASTGTLSGTPSNEDAGTYSDITITVSDGEFSASLPAFSITVNAVITNAPPQISGTPATSINANNSYSFTPDATDPDGDNLTFSLSGQPSWASFDTSTGELSGTPNDAHVGVYSNIVISVSDGQETVSLASFSISVEAISLGSATLSWTAPTKNEDGSDLIDLAGFKLYWGTSPGTYPNSVTIDNPTVTTYIVENLAPGTYEFVATSFNTSGVESRYSGAATKVIQ